MCRRGVILRCLYVAWLEEMKGPSETIGAASSLIFTELDKVLRVSCLPPAFSFHYYYSLSSWPASIDLLLSFGLFGLPAIVTSSVSTSKQPSAQQCTVHSPHVQLHRRKIVHLRLDIQPVGDSSISGGSRESIDKDVSNLFIEKMSHLPVEPEFEQAYRGG